MTNDSLKSKCADTAEAQLRETQAKLAIAVETLRAITIWKEDQMDSGYEAAKALKSIGVE